MDAPLPPDPSTLPGEPGPPPVSCPACHRRVINRRLEHCEFCEKLLPEELVFTDAEWAESRERVEAEAERARERRRQERAERREARLRALRRLGSHFGFFF